MAEFSKLRESVIFRYNVNEDGIPVSVKIENEQKQVSPLNNTVQLEQIPDPELDVVVLKNGVRMPQVDNEDEITDNTYYVNYSKGLIKFTKANAGKTTIINYYGKGVELISASRVYDEKSSSNNDVVKTLQEIIDIGKEYIEILGNVIATKKELEEMINVSTDLKNKLDNLNQEAVQNNKNLISSNATATNTNKVLKQTILEAQDDINTINATGNKSLVIGSSSFVNNEYTWTHNMNNDNLIVNFVDSVTNEPLMPDYKIVDKNNILIRNSVEHPNVKVILSASYYQGNSLFGTNVEEFADDSVGVNEKSVRLKDDNGTYQNPVTNSDSVFMADGKTKLTKKVDDISTQLEHNAKEIKSLKGNKLEKIDFDYNKILNKPHMTFNNYHKSSSIYELDKLRLLETTWSYYDGTTHPQFYPSVGMKENGEIYFQGIARIDDSAGQSLEDGMIRFAKLFHFNIEKFEGVPMWGTFIGINDDDVNDTCIIPFQLKPNGNILIKNQGENNKYYKHIDMNGGKVQTSQFGSEKILNHVRTVETTVLNRKNIDTNLLFFTDIHHKMYGTNSYRRYEQYKYINLINKEIDIVCNITGGDNIEESDTRVKAIKTMQDFLNQFEKDKLVYCNGNHDHNTQYGNNIFIHPNHVKPYINNSLTVYGGKDKYYGFTDYKERKLRVIQLDTHEATFNDNSISIGGVSDEQINWIKNNALINCPSDYNIIVVSHVAPTNKVFDGDTTLSNAYTIRTLFENFKNGTGEFASQGQRKLCCWLSGHEHADKIVTVNGISYVNTLLAASKEVGYTPQDGSYTQFTREFGTDYEFCFDIISIDSTNRKVYLDRVGKIGNIIGRTREVTF